MLDACFKDSIVLDADTTGAARDVLWENGTAARTRTVYNAGTYTVSYRTPPCTHHTDTFVVRKAIAPAVGVFYPCRSSGSNMAWVAGNTDTCRYTWTDSSGGIIHRKTTNAPDTLYDLFGGGYTLHIETASGCDTIMKIGIFPADSGAFLQVRDTLICLGDTVRLYAEGADRYRWLSYSGYISDTLIANPWISPGETWLYRVAGTKASGCADTAEVMVRVDTASEIRFRMDRDNICRGQAVTFTPEYGKGAIRNILWDFGDGSVSGSAAMHRYESGGIFIISLTAKFPACPDHSFYDTLTVHDYPVVNLGRDTFICPGSPPLRLKNLREPASSLKYQWSTGDTATSILARYPGTYYVRGTSGFGCSVTDTVRVERSCYLDIPNAFTPNGDGNNDYFFPRKILSGNLSMFRMSIYNRWGQLIWQTSGTEGMGWDGKLNGVAQPEGVYVYLIEAVINNTITETYKGNISLLY